MKARRAVVIASVLTALSGCKKSNDGTGATDAGGPVPQIAGPWVQLTTRPDLPPDAGVSTNQQQVDFGIWQAADGAWQIWECIRNTHEGEPGYNRLFYRWEGPSPTTPGWTPLGIAMESDPSVGEPPHGLQAPFVLRAPDGTFHMYYGDFEHICHATSADGKTFTRDVRNGSSALFEEGDGGIDTNTRDPMVLLTDGGYRIYYSANPRGDGGYVGGVYMRSSPDPTSFGPTSTLLVAMGGQALDGKPPDELRFSAECPFVIHDDASGYWFLFRTQTYTPGSQKTSIYRSKDPGDFGVNDDRYFVGTLPVAAPEFVRVGSDLYIVALNDDLHGVRAAKLVIE